MKWQKQKSFLLTCLTLTARWLGKPKTTHSIRPTLWRLLAWNSLLANGIYSYWTILIFGCIARSRPWVIGWWEWPGKPYVTSSWGAYSAATCNTFSSWTGSCCSRKAPTCGLCCSNLKLTRSYLSPGTGLALAYVPIRYVEDFWFAQWFLHKLRFT